MNKVYTRDSFIDSYNDLPELFRGNIRDALVEFRESKLMKSRHPDPNIIVCYTGMKPENKASNEQDVLMLN